MLSRPAVSDSAAPWTVARQAPLSMGLSRQEDGSGLPFPLPGDLPDLGIKPLSPVSPALLVILYWLGHRGYYTQPPSL